MSGFKTPLQVEACGPKSWRLLCDLVWEGSLGDTVVVPKGYVTDFASSPARLQSIFPSTGPWTKAAVVHDVLCTRLNEWHATRRGLAPAFSAVDTDAVFYKIMVDEGTPAKKAELGWLGVRYGALANPARREAWLHTFPQVAGLTVLYLIPIIVIAYLLWRL